MRVAITLIIVFGLCVFVSSNTLPKNFVSFHFSPCGVDTCTGSFLIGEVLLVTFPHILFLTLVTLMLGPVYIVHQF